jgi:UDP-glucuronate decarboxylase
MRILVTGAAGFLGSHLCDRLLRDGHDVTGLDNFHTGRRENIAHLAGEKRFEIIFHDIVTPFEGHFDQIYNLACPASPSHYQSRSLWTLKTCFTGVDNMLQLAAQTGARFLQASTSEVYGDPDIHPQTERYHGNVNPFGPRACYDEGKRVAESLCYEYRRTKGVSVKVARIFNTYGPRMDPRDGRVVSNFIVQALKGDDVTVYGDGRQSRSFCYVDDLIAGLVALMNSPGDVASPINLGNPDEFTIRQLADLIVAMTASKSAIVARPLPADDPQVRQPDISLARRQLGWAPAVPLETGLARTIAYFRDILKIAA